MRHLAIIVLCVFLSSCDFSSVRTKTNIGAASGVYICEDSDPPIAIDFKDQIIVTNLVTNETYNYSYELTSNPRVVTVKHKKHKLITDDIHFVGIMCNNGKTGYMFILNANDILLKDLTKGKKRNEHYSFRKKRC